MRDTHSREAVRLADPKTALVLVHVPLQSHGDHSYRTHSRAELLLGSSAAARNLAPKAIVARPLLGEHLSCQGAAAIRNHLAQVKTDFRANEHRTTTTWPRKAGQEHGQQLAATWQVGHRHVRRGRDLQNCRTLKCSENCLPCPRAVPFGLRTMRRFRAESVTKECFCIRS